MALGALSNLPQPIWPPKVHVHSTCKICSPQPNITKRSAPYNICHMDLMCSSPESHHLNSIRLSYDPCWGKVFISGAAKLENKFIPKMQMVGQAWSNGDRHSHSKRGSCPQGLVPSLRGPQQGWPLQPCQDSP